VSGDTGTQIAQCQIDSDAINGNENWTLLKEEGENRHKMENVNAKRQCGRSRINYYQKPIRMKDIG
jgi:hypothetical protein